MPTPHGRQAKCLNQSIVTRAHAPRAAGQVSKSANSDTCPRPTAGSCAGARCIATATVCHRNVDRNVNRNVKSQCESQACPRRAGPKALYILSPCALNPEPRRHPGGCPHDAVPGAWCGGLPSSPPPQPPPQPLCSDACRGAQTIGHTGGPVAFLQGPHGKPGSGYPVTIYIWACVSTCVAQ